MYNQLSKTLEHPENDSAGTFCHIRASAEKIAQKLKTTYGYEYVEKADLENTVSFSASRLSQIHVT